MNVQTNLRLPDDVAAAVRAGGGADYVAELVRADMARREGTAPPVLDLDADAIRALATAEDPARWVSGLVVEDALEVEQAWQLLRMAGWTREQLRSCVDTLNGTSLLPYLPGAVALSLYDAERLDGTATRHGAAEGWDKAVRRAQDSEQDRALWVVARDFWRDGPSAKRIG